MSEKKQLSKQELIDRIRDQKFFKNNGINAMYARGNGHMYYTKPPEFIDDYTTHIITREDVEKNDTPSYPMNQKDSVKAIKGCETDEELQALYTSGQLLKEDNRQGVLKALEEKEQELSSNGE